jgi:hypothetical protein
VLKIPKAPFIGMIMGNLRSIVISTLLICISQFCKAQNINEGWVREDSLFIDQVKQAYNSDPLSIEKSIEPWENARVNLGYGYSVIQSSTGKGYVSIFYTCVYKDRKLISYMLDPQMPHDDRLTYRYISFYKVLFKIENNWSMDLYFGYEKMTKPLEESENVLKVSDALGFLMTPFSGIVYGDFEGFDDQIVENRRAYNKVKDSINEKELLYLLRSINPATRLTAAEHYFKNIDNYLQHSLIERLIEDNYKELPAIQTISVDLVNEEDAKEVLRRMINKK